MHTDCIAVFAKLWTPGRVKTRLGAAIGDAAAAAVYRALLEATLSRLSNIDAERIIAVDPAESIPAMREFAPIGWRFVGQSTGDLGRRMQTLLDQQFAAGRQRVVLLGADSPNVPIDFVKDALASLHAADVVIGPTDDGGYYLIGAAHCSPPIFNDMPWSRGELFASTITTLEASGRQYHVLPQWYDIDEIDDLRRLATDLANGGAEDPELCRLLDVILKTVRLRP